MVRQNVPRGDPETRRELRVSVHVRDDDGALGNEVEVIERHVRFALARFGRIVGRVRVDLRRARRRVVTCRVQLFRAREQAISSLALDTDPMIAFSLAQRQAMQELARRLRRGRALAARHDRSTSV